MTEELLAEIVDKSVDNAMNFAMLSDPRREKKVRRQILRRVSIDHARFLARIFQCIAPENRQSFEAIASMLADHGSLKLFSAACFHATSNRMGIVSELSLTIVELIKKTAESVFAEAPIEYWNFYTFSPGDWDFLVDWDVTETVLPYIHELGPDQKDAEFRKQYELTLGVVEQLDQILPFPVSLYPIRDIASMVLREEVLAEANARAGLMFEKIKKSPPAIFEFLSSDEERIERCRKEAILYLAFARAFGSSNMVYVGKEVHGGYWRSGKLNVWGDNFLPLTWVHPAISQHWGTWAEETKGYRILEYQEFLESTTFV